eukprot:TRINITY_DN24258_c0_g1_i1.p1 TRINITY_DN24258_c0_g1~~TRINITY_DN24258_c0_g1_i1.p1  ORF type:complete len:437 (+),score=82.89 TRINITY_DN24258_c0_g1_i1:36-1313(+)
MEEAQTKLLAYKRQLSDVNKLLVDNEDNEQISQMKADLETAVQTYTDYLKQCGVEPEDYDEPSQQDSEEQNCPAEQDNAEEVLSSSSSVVELVVEDDDGEEYSDSADEEEEDDREYITCSSTDDDVQEIDPPPHKKQKTKPSSRAPRSSSSLLESLSSYGYSWWTTQHKLLLGQHEDGHQRQTEPTTTTHTLHSPNLDSAEEFGSWQAHTNGFGMKMLQAMGYTKGQGLGRRGEGIAYPVTAYDVAVCSKTTGLGHETRITKSERHTQKNQHKRQRRKANRGTGGGGRRHEDDDGGRMFAMLDRISKHPPAGGGEHGGAGSGDTSKQGSTKKESNSTTMLVKYRKMTKPQLQEAFASKLKYKDNLQREIKALQDKLHRGGTETSSHGVSSQIERKTKLLATATQEQLQLTKLMNERDKQRKMAVF